MNAISKDNTHLDTAGSKLAALNDWVASVAVRGRSTTEDLVAG